MRIPDPKANTTTEAYLAYKAGYLEESELKPVLYEPYLHFDAWLAYWAGLTRNYPSNMGKNLFIAKASASSYGMQNTQDPTTGIFHTTGTATQSWATIFKIQNIYMPAGTYTISVTKALPFTVVVRVWERTEDASSRRDYSIPAGQTSFTFTTDFNSRGIGGYAADLVSGREYDETFGVQLEAGYVATDYEPATIIPEMLCDEEALVAYLAGVTDTYPEEIKDPYDVRIVGYLKYLVSIRYGRPEYPVNNEEFYLSTMTAPVIPSGDPSSSIEIDGTAEAPFALLEAYGDTAQKTYSGLQLLTAGGMSTPSTDTSFWKSFTSSAISLTPQSGGWGKISQIQQTYGNFHVAWDAIHNMAASTTYTLIIELRNVVSKGAGAIDFIQTGQDAEPFESFEIITGGSGSTSAILRTTFENPDSVTVAKATTKSSATAIGLRLFTRNTTPVGSSFDIRVTVLDGDHSSDWQNYAGDNWQPYVGNIPSPSPDYPQDVQVVTGEQTVKVSGKNLFDKNNVNQYMGYFDGAADNPTLVSGTANRNRVIYIKCNPSTTYSISLTNRDGINSPQVGTTDSLPDTGVAVTKLGNFESGSLKLENLTTSATAQYIVIRFQTNPSTVRFDDISQALLAGLQIEQSSIATAYEHYQGQTYEINLGKNLFDKNNTTIYGGYFGGSPVSIRNMTSPPASADRWFYIPCKPNTTYTVTKPVQTTTSLNRFRLGTVSTTPDNLMPLSDYWNAGDGSTTTVHTITTGADAKYLCVYFAKGTDTADSDGQIQAVIDGLQIELGSTASSYASYFTPIELCKIGDYQDYIYKSGGDWYVHKEIGKDTLDGTEIFQKSGVNDNVSFYWARNYAGQVPRFANIRESLITQTGAGIDYVFPFFSNRFPRMSTNQVIYSSSIGAGFNRPSATNLNFRMGMGLGTAINDVTKFTNFVMSNPITVYYPLETFTSTKITNQNLISQLDAIVDGGSYNGKTYINVSSAGYNLPALLKVEAYKY